MSYLAICAIFKDEAPYLKEWIDFHLKEGCSKFYLYNNFSQDAFQEVLDPYVISGIVTLTDWPQLFSDGGQENAYSHCLAVTKDLHRWVAFIDIDEFLFGVKSRLVNKLQAYEEFPAVAVNTICYGTFTSEKTLVQGVTQSLVYRAPLNWYRNRIIKCIVNPSEVSVCFSPHSFDLSGERIVNEKGERLTKRKGSLRRRYYKFVSKNKTFIRYLAALFPMLIDAYGGNKYRFNSVEELRINHYVLRSAQAFQHKQQRFLGSQHAEKYDSAYFRYHNQNQVYDPILKERT